MKTKFTRLNRADLWKLREFYGHAALLHFRTDPVTMRDTEVTSEHADRIMEAGGAVLVIVPMDPESPVEQFRIPAA